MNRFLIAALLALLVPLAARGADDPAKDPPKEGARGASPAHGAPSPSPDPLPADSTTRHSLHLGDRELAYEATAGSLPLMDVKGERKADMFYVAYKLPGASPSRPITFAFNGGPGAGSAYLQLGALGPRVLDVGDTPAEPSQNAHLIDNPETWLDLTDLVFVDPVGTGYSRGVGSEEEIAKQFWGVKQDIEAMAAFVRLYLTRAGRLGAPKYLVGESYGGFRAARLAHALQDDLGIAIAGSFMISPVLEFETMSESAYQPLGWALRLPSYAATKLESEGRLSPDALADVERFARGDYLAALASGPRDPEVAARIDTAVAGFTGLPRELVDRLQGRIPLNVFVKEFRRADGRLVSRYDGSVSAADPFPTSLTPRGGDAVLRGTIAPFTSGFVDYARDELGFRTDISYHLLSNEVSGKWDWRSGGSQGFGGQGYAGSLDDLREALALNPQLHVIVAHGMTDLVTPYFASRFLIDQLPQLGEAPRVTLKLYPGGHMMYLRAASRTRLHQDAGELYRAGAG
jgi:carboxypeptidase C (cathepsin A)